MHTKGPVVWILVGVLFTAGWASAQVEKGFRSGPLAFSPFLQLDGAYDSNIRRATTGAEEDFFFDGTAGLTLRYLTDELEGNGLGFVNQRLYADKDDLNFTAAGEALKLRLGAPERITLEAQESYRKVEDLDEFGPQANVGGMSPDAFLDADMRSRREILEAGAVLDATLTDKSDVRAGYRFDQTDYADPSLFDLSGHGVNAEGAYRVTDKSSALLTLMGGLQDSESVDDNGKYGAARVGVRTHGTDRLTFKAGAGYQQLERPEDGGTEDGAQYDATGLWKATDKTTVELEGRNGIQLSSLYRANAVDYNVFRLGLAYRMTQFFALSLSSVFRIDDYVDKVTDDDGNLVDREDKGGTAQLRADYRIPSKYMRLYAELMYEKVDSNVRDYEVSRASLGMAFER